MPGSFLSGYKCFYKSKTLDIYAMTSYDAQKEAAKLWKVKENKRYMITVMLCEDSGGNQVTHSTSSL